MAAPPAETRPSLAVPPVSTAEALPRVIPPASMARLWLIWLPVAVAAELLPATDTTALLVVPPKPVSTPMFDAVIWAVIGDW